MVGPGKDFRGSVNFERFCGFWLDLGRIYAWTVRIWNIFRILVGSGKDFHGSVYVGGFERIWFDVGRISMDPWIFTDFCGF